MATITFRLVRLKQKDGKLKAESVSIQVELYISKDRRAELSTGKSITPIHSHTDKQRAKSNYSGHTELNLHLVEIEMVSYNY